jgi:flagellar biosynthesis protein FliP
MRGRALRICALGLACSCPAVMQAMQSASSEAPVFGEPNQTAVPGNPFGSPDPFTGSSESPSPIPTSASIPLDTGQITSPPADSLTKHASAKVGSGGTAVAPGVRISGLGSSSAPWTIIILLTFLALIPSLMICVTPFARLLVVFHFLRQALGLQTTPSNQTLIGLSLVLTFFIMEPVGTEIYQDAFLPLQKGQITAFEAVSRGSDPLRHFMSHYVREKDAAMFLDIAHVPRPHTVDDIPMRVMMPAYIVSELRAGFEIGAILFLPFLVVDMVVASITNSVGMMQLPPVVISTPLKLMLFLMVDGWHLLIGALVRSFS